MTESIMRYVLALGLFLMASSILNASSSGCGSCWWVFCEYWFDDGMKYEQKEHKKAIEELENEYLGIERIRLLERLQERSSHRLIRPYVRERILDSSHSIFAWFIFPIDDSFTQFSVTFYLDKGESEKVIKIGYSTVYDFTEGSKEIIKSKNFWLERELTNVGGG